MRPYVEIFVEPKLVASIKNVGKSRNHVFSSRGGSALSGTLISMNMEESDGDDVATNRKGKRNQLTLTFLDELSESPTFLSETGLINVGDLIYIEFGWVLENGHSVKSPLSPREFRVVKLEPQISETSSTFKVTAHDRSVDLDMASTAISFENIPLTQVVRNMAQSVGLDFVFNKNAFNTFLADVSEEQRSVLDESFASYIAYLAADSGSIFYVENRTLYFGARIIDKTPKYTFTRGTDYRFDPDSDEDFTEMPLLDLSIERDLNHQSWKQKITSQDKRNAVISFETQLANEVRELTLGLSASSSIFAQEQEKLQDYFQESLNDWNDLPDNKKPARLPFEENVSKVKSNIDTFLDDTYDPGGAQRVQDVKDRNELSNVVTRMSSADEEFAAKFNNGQKLFTSDMVRSVTHNLNPAMRERKIKELAAQLLAQHQLRSMKGTLKILGNPKIRPGDSVTFKGKFPVSYKFTWYVQGVKHDINGNNYFTTVELLAASPDNVFAEEKLKQSFDRLAGKKQQLKRDTKNRRTSD